MSDHKTKVKVKVTKLEKATEIPNARLVKVTTMNKIVEILSACKTSDSLQQYRKYSKTEYIDLETGEIHQYTKKSENRAENIKSVQATFKRLRQLVNNNFIGAPNEEFVTLTYGVHFIAMQKKYITPEQVKRIKHQYKIIKDHKCLMTYSELLILNRFISQDQLNKIELEMCDTKMLYGHIKVFVKTLRRKFKDVDYIVVIEPQGNQSWHCHILFRFNDSEVFKSVINTYESDREFNDNVIAPMWGLGFTTTRLLKDCDNVGAYLSAYLADVEVCADNVDTLNEVLSEQNITYDMIEKDVDGKKKKFLKGARLCLYPSHMKIYRSSRNIKTPTTEEMIYEDAKKIVGSTKANYSRTVRLTCESEDGKEHFINEFTTEQYNLSRKKLPYRHRVSKKTT